MHKIDMTSQNMCSNKAVLLIKLLFTNMKPVIGKQRELEKDCGGKFETHHILKAVQRHHLVTEQKHYSLKHNLEGPVSGDPNRIVTGIHSAEHYRLSQTTFG